MEISYICGLHKSEYTLKRYSYYIFVLIAVLVTSCKMVSLKEADKRFAKGEYYDAAEMYRKVYRKTSPKKRDLRGIVAFRMGESYRIVNMPVQAVSAYTNAERYNVQDSTLSLQFARVLHKTGNYKKAAEQYEAFLQMYPGNQFALNGIRGTQLAAIWRANPTRYLVKRMDIFMAGRGGEFAPMLLPPDYDQLFFTSNRKEAKGDKVSAITGLKNNDIFFSRKDENGNWKRTEILESGVNTNYDEGIVSFTGDGSLMYYTYSPQDSINSSYTSIYTSSRSGGSWSEGKILAIGRDSMAVYAHPAITPSGEYLYFVSDLPGGYGGKDIWRAQLYEGKVNFIENLGPSINTAGDEMFPYTRNDSTLYFSSDGHPGMGGLDIFKAVFNSLTNQWKVENMQYPINSQGDDFGITFEGNDEKGFFSTNRNEGRGYDRIYSFVNSSSQVSIEGYIVDPDDEFVTNATIRAVGNDGTNNKIQGRINGTYKMEANSGVDYVFLASGEGYLNTRMAQSTVPNIQDSIYLVDFVMTPINKPVVLENIFFDFNKATLRPESKEALDGLIDLLKLNPNVTIELSAHTDRKGTDEYNDNLSQRRAETVVDYLIHGGIEKDRLEAKGYGKRHPKTVTKSIVKKYGFLKEGDILTEDFILEEIPDEDRESVDGINRRIEFKVLSITYNME